MFILVWFKEQIISIYKTLSIRKNNVQFMHQKHYYHTNIM
jgi:hypothetical protein